MHFSLLRGSRSEVLRLSVAFLSLAAGAWAAMTVFAVLDSVVLAPLPFASPSRLMLVSEENRTTGMPKVAVADANFLDWREQAESFSSWGAMVLWAPTLPGREGAEKCLAAKCTPGFFQTLEVAPQLGTTFLEEEAGEKVVLLTHAAWQRRYGGNPQVLGTSVILNGQSYTVTGVLPETFRWFTAGSAEQPELWVPLAITQPNRKGRYLTVIGRLRDEASVDQAQSEMETLSRRLAEDHRENTGWGATVVPLTEEVTAEIGRPLQLLTVAVCFVLLVCTLNVVNLWLVRNLRRRGEIGIRIALGATTARLGSRLIWEGLAFSLLAGMTATLAAVWGLEPLMRWLPPDIPRIDEAFLGTRAVILGGAAFVVIGLIIGGQSVAHMLGLDLRSALGESTERSSGARGSLRLREGVVVVEVALAFLLLVGAGMIGKSVLNLYREDLGFDPERLVAARLGLPNSKYLEPSRRLQFVRSVGERAAAVRGITEVAVSSSPPTTRAEPWEAVVGEERVVTGMRSVGPGYFRTAGIRLLEGRDFQENDSGESERVAIINRRLSKRFPPGTAVGSSIRFSLMPKYVWKVVGVVEDTKVGPQGASGYEVYQAFLQRPQNQCSFLLRTKSDPTAVIPTLRGLIGETDREVSIKEISTVEAILWRERSDRRAVMIVLAWLTVIGLLTAGAGVFAVVSSYVEERRHEIGIRLALGELPGSVFRRVALRGFRPAALGVLLGAPAFVALFPQLKPLLYGVTAYDRFVFSGGIIIILGTAGLSVLVPAMRAVRLNPVALLRRT